MQLPGCAAHRSCWPAVLHMYLHVPLLQAVELAVQPCRVEAGAGLRTASGSSARPCELPAGLDRTVVSARTLPVAEAGSASVTDLDGHDHALTGRQAIGLCKLRVELLQLTLCLRPSRVDDQQQAINVLCVA
jgi:hypothetical protein